MSVLVFNRKPVLLLAKNAFFRRNAGFVGAFMLVSAFLGYVDGISSYEILLDFMLGIYLVVLAVKAYGAEAKMYKYIWGETYYKIQNLLLCDPTSLSEEEAELQRQYAELDGDFSLEQQVTIIAVNQYIEYQNVFDERYAKEHKISYYIGNAALLIIILDIAYSIITHI